MVSIGVDFGYRKPVTVIRCDVCGGSPEYPMLVDDQRGRKLLVEFLKYPFEAQPGQNISKTIASTIEHLNHIHEPRMLCAAQCHMPSISMMLHLSWWEFFKLWWRHL